jgi:hypothetical protein
MLYPALLLQLATSVSTPSLNHEPQSLPLQQQLATIFEPKPRILLCPVVGQRLCQGESRLYSLSAYGRNNGYPLS